MSNVSNFNIYQITASKFAINGKDEKSKVTCFCAAGVLSGDGMGTSNKRLRQLMICCSLYMALEMICFSLVVQGEFFNFHSKLNSGRS